MVPKLRGQSFPGPIEKATDRDLVKGPEGCLERGGRVTRLPFHCEPTPQGTDDHDHAQPKGPSSDLSPTIQQERLKKVELFLDRKGPKDPPKKTRDIPGK